MTPLTPFMRRLKPLKQTIAIKIFGLAVFLLLLTLVLAAFLLLEVASTERHLRIVADFNVPLAQTISRIAECGVRRRLAFARLYGGVAFALPNPEIRARE